MKNLFTVHAVIQGQCAMSGKKDVDCVEASGVDGKRVTVSLTKLIDFLRLELSKAQPGEPASRATTKPDAA